MSIVAVIAHAAHVPERKATLELLRDQLAEQGIAHFTDSTKGPPHVWAAAQLRVAASLPSDHVLMLNDDVELCDDFKARLDARIKERPRSIICLTNHHEAARMDGVRWLKSYDGCVGQAYVLPREVIESLVNFRNGPLDHRNLELDHRHMNFIAEDGVVNLWAMAHRRRIWSTVPAMAAQRNVGSLYDHDGDWARRSVVGIHEQHDGRAGVVDIGRTHVQHCRHLLLTIRREHWRQFDAIERYYEVSGS